MTWLCRRLGTKSCTSSCRRGCLGTFGHRYLPHFCTSDVSYLNLIAYHQGVLSPRRVEIDGDLISQSSTLRHVYDGWCRCVNPSLSSFICSERRLKPRSAIPLCGPDGRRTADHQGLRRARTQPSPFSLLLSISLSRSNVVRTVCPAGQSGKCLFHHAAAHSGQWAALLFNGPLVANTILI